MANTNIDGSLLKVFLTSTGYIALCSNQLGAADEAALFGANGKMPPRPVRDFVKDILSDMQIAPQADDASELRHLETELEMSLSLTRKAISKL